MAFAGTIEHGGGHIYALARALRTRYFPGEKSSMMRFRMCNRTLTLPAWPCLSHPLVSTRGPPWASVYPRTTLTRGRDHNRQTPVPPKSPSVSTSRRPRGGGVPLHHRHQSILGGCV
eukprot:2159277-Prymnesium_polylepis.1